MTDEPDDDASGEAGAAAPPPLPQPSLDPRRHAVRPDLAALSLRGHVSAPRYAAGSVRQVARPAVPLRREPNPTLGLDTEALYGELVKVYEDREGWAWVQLERDRYVGYVPSAALTGEIMPMTHRVNALGTFIYPAADIKTPPVMLLPLNAELRVAEWGERFCRLERGGFVITRHLTERDRFERDFTDIAERMIGSPYLWGGCTRIGIDCSGLVQMALQAAGVKAPRDTDMQAAEIGQEIPIPEELEGLQRGDLVFWQGHVGIMSDAIMLVHANAHHMAVAAETLPEAADRIARQGGPITTIRRLDLNRASG